jgi:MFS family permease
MQGRAWYHGWNIVALCVLLEMAGVGLTIICNSLFMPSWTKTFGVPVSTIAMGITFFSFGTVAIGYMIGIWTTRYTTRRLFLTGLLLLGTAHLLIAAAQQVWQILAIYGLILPFAIGLTGSITCQALVSRWFVRRVGLAMGLTIAGLAVPGLLFPSAIVKLLEMTSWRVLWAGVGAIILIVLVPLMLAVVRERPAEDDPFGYVTRKTGATAGESIIGLRDIVGRRNFVVVVAAFLSVQCIPMMLYINLTPIIESYGGNARLSGYFLMTFAVSAMISKMGGGWLADRVGSRIPLVVAALGTGTGALLLSVPSADPAYLFGVAIAIGMSGASWTLVAASLLAEFGAKSFGRAYGLASALSPIATLSAGVVAKLEEVSGSYAGPLLTLGGLAIASALMVLVVFRPRSEHAASASAIGGTEGHPA